MTVLSDAAALTLAGLAGWACVTLPPALARRVWVWAHPDLARLRAAERQRARARQIRGEQ